MKDDLGELIDLIWKMDEFLLKGKDDSSKMIAEDHKRITHFLNENYFNKHQEDENKQSELVKETARWLYHELDNEPTALNIIRSNSKKEKENYELDNLIKLEAVSFRLYKRNSSNISKSKKGGIIFLNVFLLYYSQVGIDIFNRLNLNNKLKDSQYEEYKKLRGYFKSVYEEWQRINKEKVTEERIIGFLDYISDKGWNLVRTIKKEHHNNLIPVRTYLNLLDKMINKYDELLLRDAELRKKNSRTKKRKI